MCSDNSDMVFMTCCNKQLRKYKRDSSTFCILSPLFQHFCLLECMFYLFPMTRQKKTRFYAIIYNSKTLMSLRVQLILKNLYDAEV